MISLIAAMSNNHVIGVDNKLPWDLPADMAHFKALTLNKPVVMGRKTYDSIGRALPKRRNLIVTRQEDFEAKGCEVFHSIESALDACSGSPEVMVIGGANIYAQTLNYADRLYLTIVDTEISGDAFFPDWSEHKWHIIEETIHEPDEKNNYRYCFMTLER